MPRSVQVGPALDLPGTPLRAGHARRHGNRQQSLQIGGRPGRIAGRQGVKREKWAGARDPLQGIHFTRLIMNHWGGTCPLGWDWRGAVDP
jgi:hypothetical protein